MATKSILKNITIKDKAYCRSFVSALENSQYKHSKQVTTDKKIRDLSREEIKKVFGA